MADLLRRFWREVRRYYSPQQISARLDALAARINSRTSSEVPKQEGTPCPPPMPESKETE